MEAREGMNAKHGYASAVLLVLLGGPFAQAQMPQNLPAMSQTALVVPPPDPTPAASMPASPAPMPGNLVPMPASPAPMQAIVPDPWMLHQQPEPFNKGCCGPVGGDGPIGWEVYARGGASFHYSNTAYAKSLDTGYEADAGWRSLFFNKDADCVPGSSISISSISTTTANPRILLLLPASRRPCATWTAQRWV